MHYSLVIFISFSVAISILFVYAWPVVRVVPDVNRVASLSLEELQRARQRCLNLGSRFWSVIFTLWVSTGIVYPLLTLNFRHDGWLRACAQFFTAQLLHGLIASSVTFLVVTLVTTRSLFPRLGRASADVDARQRLPALDALVDRQAAILALISPISLVALALFNRRDSKELSLVLL